MVTNLDHSCLHAGDPAALGPGSYNIVTPWATNSKHGNYRPAPAFASGAARGDARAKALAALPAPGAYNAPDVDKVFKPVSYSHAAFGSGGDRLNAYWKPTPGPGSYAVDSKWVKRSYNVSLDDTVLA